ncbi:hypothetical protein QLX08_001814 [Tetragonisca angustula]|uniref:Uncharacterized protein n=1 Tax=Tetragonisca angustula TaxID=166442 RepID=A0AAW1AG79_9HYME
MSRVISPTKHFTEITVSSVDNEFSVFQLISQPRPAGTTQSNCRRNYISCKIDCEIQPTFRKEEGLRQVGVVR